MPITSSSVMSFNCLQFKTQIESVYNEIEIENKSNLNIREAGTRDFFVFVCCFFCQMHRIISQWSKLLLINFVSVVMPAIVSTCNWLFSKCCLCSQLC